MAKGNYGIDSPAILGTLAALGVSGLSAGVFLRSGWRWVGFVIGGYFLLGALGMLYYSKVGKLGLRERLLDGIAWRGDEKVLDVGCGRGLLAVGAARRLTSGKVTGVDVWLRGAISGNRSQSVLDNAKAEAVGERVEVKEGDVRKLPFADGSFDVVLSNFVVHELNARSEREQMMREVARVLKPGGQLALVDFIFTDECVEGLRKFGVTAERQRDQGASFWITAALNFGMVRTYRVIGRKE
jgi:SAM-dependent methyltransferase